MPRGQRGRHRLCREVQTRRSLTCRLRPAWRTTPIRRRSRYRQSRRHQRRRAHCCRTLHCRFRNCRHRAIHRWYRRPTHCHLIHPSRHHLNHRIRRTQHRRRSPRFQNCCHHAIHRWCRHPTHRHLIHPTRNRRRRGIHRTRHRPILRYRPTRHRSREFRSQTGTLRPAANDVSTWARSAHSRLSPSLIPLAA